MGFIQRYSILFLCCLALGITNSMAQSVPSGFKYQTTVRDASGVIISNQAVQLRYSFYSDSITGTLLWQEDHALATDAYGLVTTVIGKGVSTGAGNVSSFNQINWSHGIIFLKVSVDPTGGSSFTDVGNSQLFSVPYAFHAFKSNMLNNINLGQFADVDTAGLVSGKLLKWNGTFWMPSMDNNSDTVLFADNTGYSQTSDTSLYIVSSNVPDTVLFAYDADSTIFSINSGTVNNTNSAVFSDTAVYALTGAPSAWEISGSTVNSSSKYIGTNDSADVIWKSNNQEHLRFKSSGHISVNNAPDSSGLSILNTDGFLTSGTFGSGTFPVSGAGTRLLWYSSKGAFRAGGVDSTAWDDAKIGNYSFAVGHNTSSNRYSFVSGDNCSGGDYTVVMGRKSQAYALGNYPGGTGIAIGDSCIASGRSVVMGVKNETSNVTCVAIGQRNKASGSVALALGVNSLASGHYSAIIGYYGSSNSKAGCFIYADASSSAVTAATAANQFIVRASGGIVFYTDSAHTMGVTLAAGDGSWASVSDVNKKENFESVDLEDMLTKIESLKIKSWNYKSQRRSVRHIGPMAQDFYRTFNLGDNNTTISGVDMDGVIISGIKGLHFRTLNLKSLNVVDNLKSKTACLNTDFEELNKRLDVIESSIK